MHAVCSYGQVEAADPMPDSSVLCRAVLCQQPDLRIIALCTCMLCVPAAYPVSRLGVHPVTPTIATSVLGQQAYLNVIVLLPI